MGQLELGSSEIQSLAQDDPTDQRRHPIASRSQTVGQLELGSSEIQSLAQDDPTDRRRHGRAAPELARPGSTTRQEAQRLLPTPKLRQTKKKPGRVSGKGLTRSGTRGFQLQQTEVLMGGKLTRCWPGHSVSNTRPKPDWCQRRTLLADLEV